MVGTILLLIYICLKLMVGTMIYVSRLHCCVLSVTSWICRQSNKKKVQNI